MNDFERLRVIHDFRQPSSFIGFELVYLLLFPLLLSPHFAQISKDSGLWAGIYSSVFSTLLVVGLFHVLRDTEDPFDGFGIDDLNVHMIEEAPLHMWKMQTEMPEREAYSDSLEGFHISTRGTSTKVRGKRRKMSKKKSQRHSSSTSEINKSD